MANFYSIKTNQAKESIVLSFRSSSPRTTMLMPAPFRSSTIVLPPINNLSYNKNYGTVMFMFSTDCRKYFSAATIRNSHILLVIFFFLNSLQGYDCIQANFWFSSSAFGRFWPRILSMLKLLVIESFSISFFIYCSFRCCCFGCSRIALCGLLLRGNSLTAVKPAIVFTKGRMKKEYEEDMD